MFGELTWPICRNIYHNTGHSTGHSTYRSTDHSIDRSTCRSIYHSTCRSSGRSTCRKNGRRSTSFPKSRRGNPRSLLGMCWSGGSSGACGTRVPRRRTCHDRHGIPDEHRPGSAQAGIVPSLVRRPVAALLSVSRARSCHREELRRPSGMVGVSLLRRISLGRKEKW